MGDNSGNTMNRLFTGKKVYLSGPMRGIPFFNARAFEDARRQIKSEAPCSFVFDPVKADQQHYGFYVWELPADYDWNTLPDNLPPLETIAKRDLRWVVDSDVLVALPGWEKSKGARAEIHTAFWVRKPIYAWPDLQEIIPDVEVTAEPPARPKVTAESIAEGLNRLRSQIAGAAKSEIPGVPEIAAGMSDSDPAELHHFQSGAVRSSDADNEAWHLMSPIGLRRVAETCREGERKYDAYNWEKGMPTAEILNHAIRHIYLYLAGDRSEDHLAHTAWNMLAAMHSEELWPELNAGTLRQEGCKAP